MNPLSVRNDVPIKQRIVCTTTYQIRAQLAQRDEIIDPSRMLTPVPRD